MHLCSREYTPYVKEIKIMKQGIRVESVVKIKSLLVMTWNWHNQIQIMSSKQTLEITNYQIE